MNDLTTMPETSDDADVLADGLLNVRDAAAFLSVGVRTLYDAMARGELQFCKIGRARRIPRRALIDFARANMQGGWNRVT